MIDALRLGMAAGSLNATRRGADALGVESNPERKEWEAFLFRD